MIENDDQSQGTDCSRRGRYLSRRRYLAAAGMTVGAGVLAGCSGDGQSGQNGATGTDGGTETTTGGGGDATMTTVTTTDNKSDEDGVTEVAAGPNGNLVFKPETVEIPLGGTVRWNFKSPGHNVSAKPEASNVVTLPQGAEPFASYPDGKSYQIVPEGESYSHTFETPGKYVYICVPHVSAGMVGTVNVSK